jgi:hypothetical protein
MWGTGNEGFMLGGQVVSGSKKARHIDKGVLNLEGEANQWMRHAPSRTRLVYFVHLLSRHLQFQRGGVIFGRLRRKKRIAYPYLNARLDDGAAPVHGAGLT